MLSMKTLRVAIGAVASALLLGPGLGNAVDVKLDARTPQTPVVYAVETLGGNPTTVARVPHYRLMAPTANAISDDSTPGLTVSVASRRRIEDGERVFVRVSLGSGLVFAATPSLGEPTVTADVVTAGGEGMSYAIFRLSSSLPLGSTITADLGDSLAVVRETGSYSISMSAHGDPDEAIAGTNARGTLFSGSLPVVRVVNGLMVDVMQGATATAEVATGFLWFVGPAAQSKLGWVKVAPTPVTDNVLLDASDGQPVNADTDGDPSTDNNDLLSATGINIEVSGDLSVGAFSFVPDVLSGTPGSYTRSRSVACPKGAPNAPNSGTLMIGEGPDRMALIDADGMMTAATSASDEMRPRLPDSNGNNIYSLCIDVDYLGPQTNTNPIPNATYTATVSTTGVAPGARPQEAASGTIGKLQRNGASAEIAYLTVSDKYNQRLVIANRGPRPARYDIGEFVTEDGTMVDLSDDAKAARAAGLNMVPAKGQVVLRVADLLEFSGSRARAAATVSVNALSGNVQVATTQVNLEDGSTDTVVYRTDQGSGLD